MCPLWEDQQCAGALMWTCVTLVYVLPGAFATARLLSRPRSFAHYAIGQSETQLCVARQSDVQRMEAV